MGVYDLAQKILEGKMTDIHIGEMLARNARMYPDKIALVERIPAEKNGSR
jgi:hypothetical protein